MKSQLLVLMGVSGCGKSSVGIALHQRLGVSFIDADNLHPASNIAKMAGGHSLIDEDRWCWLDAVADAMCNEKHAIVICACSALKKKYRQRMCSRAGRAIVFVHLAGSFEVIHERMRARTHHFMPIELLWRQFQDLEPPSSEEPFVSIDVTASKDVVVCQIINIITPKE